MKSTAYVVAALIGAALFVIVGYFADAGLGGVSFNYWVSNPATQPVAQWAGFGALIGSGLFWLARAR